MAGTQDKEQEEEQEKVGLTVLKKHGSNRRWKSLSWCMKEISLWRLTAQVDDKRKKLEAFCLYAVFSFLYNVCLFDIFCLSVYCCIVTGAPKRGGLGITNILKFPYINVSYYWKFKKK
jgi:hypothetical protein